MTQTTDPSSKSVRDANGRIKAADCVLFITGAGISHESGIPTFRGEGGRWKGHGFHELATPEMFARDPRLVWDWYLYRREVVAQCKPNAAHIALTEWAKAHTGTALVTQNVDGLHEASGFPDVIRYHGSLWSNRCTQCGKEREDHALQYDDLPRSPCCNTLERPAIVWFNESISGDAWRTTMMRFIAADVIIVIGTSGVIGGLPRLLETAHLLDKYIIEVNPEVTPLPRSMHLQMLATIGVTSLLAQ